MNLLEATKRVEARYAAEVEHLRSKPPSEDWKPLFVAEHKLETATVLRQAIEEFTSEGNK